MCCSLSSSRGMYRFQLDHIQFVQNLSYFLYSFNGFLYFRYFEYRFMKKGTVFGVYSQNTIPFLYFSTLCFRNGFFSVHLLADKTEADHLHYDRQYPGDRI